MFEIEPSSKANQQFYKKVSDSFIMPSLIQLEKNIYALVFRLMKLLPARHIIIEALKNGEIQQDSIIIDTSSGTFALGLGLICCEMDLKFRIFGDPVIDKNLIHMLQDLGGDVHLVNKSNNPGAYQKERLKQLHNFMEKESKSFWARQYDNLNNFNSYACVTEFLLSTLGNNITLIGAVGSGGSTGGIISGIRKKNINAKLIGVDTFNSVLFGQPDGKRILRGLGNSIMPKNLHHDLYDEIHWIDANEAFFYTRWLYKNKGLFCGSTTGAAFQVTSYLASKKSNETFVFIAPDEGYRYLDTVYNDDWIKIQGFYNQELTLQPTKVTHPLEAKPSWSFIAWDRRPYSQVLGV